MKLKTTAVIAPLIVLSLAFAQPVQAVGLDSFSSFVDGVKLRFNRAYLMLPGSKSGSSVLQQSAVAMDGLKSFQTVTTVKGDAVDQAGQTQFSGAFTFSGPVEVKDVFDPTTARQEMNMVGELSMQGTSLKANADFKVDGQIVYVKLNELPILPFFNLSKLKGQWLKIDTQKMNDEAIRLAAENGQPLPSATPFENTPLTTDQQHQLQQAFMDLIMSSQISDAKKEKLGDHNVFVVSVTMPDAAVVEYVKKVNEIQKIETTAESLEGMNETLASMEDLTATLSIDRSSFYVRHFELPMTFDVQKAQAAEMTTDDSAMSSSQALSLVGGADTMKSFKLVISGDLDQFNEPVSFSMPSDARDFQEAAAEVFGAMGGSMGASPMMTTPQLPSSYARPTELQNLSESEKALLRQYGVDPNSL